jgi:Ca2+-binding EF-hand superfamily protein
MYQFEDRFTDIELEKFKQAFVFFDRDGDGTMACDDVCLAMRAMGALATEKEVKNLLKKYDAWQKSSTKMIVSKRSRIHSLCLTKPTTACSQSMK